MAEVSAVQAHGSAIVHGQEITPLELNGARRTSPRLARRDHKQLGQGRLSHIHILHIAIPTTRSNDGAVAGYGVATTRHTLWGRPQWTGAGEGGPPMISTELLVVGAGPYALSTAGLARERGIKTVVVGRPMEFWRDNMPEGMFLRSGPIGIWTRPELTPWRRSWRTAG